MKFKKAFPFNLIDDIVLRSDYSTDLEADELTQEVDTILRGLYRTNTRISEKMRAVIFLYYSKELTQREIGGLMGISSSRVSQIKQRVLRIIRHPSRLCRLMLHYPSGCTSAPDESE